MHISPYKNITALSLVNSFVTVKYLLKTKRGIEKERIQIAIHLLKRGMSISEIATITSLSKDEIERLRT